MSLGPGFSSSENMKLEVARAFQGFNGMALAPIEPAELHQLQCNIQSKEPICQGNPSSTMHESFSDFENLVVASAAIWHSSASALQLSALTRTSNARSR
jgi:hypothetical protein